MPQKLYVVLVRDVIDRVHREIRVGTLERIEDLNIHRHKLTLLKKNVQRSARYGKRRALDFKRGTPRYQIVLSELKREER